MGGKGSKGWVLVECMFGAKLRQIMARFDPVNQTLAHVMEEYTSEQLQRRSSSS